MILDGWSWAYLYVLAVLFGGIPLFLEIVVLVAAWRWFKTYSYIEDKQLKDKMEQDKLFREKSDRLIMIKTKLLEKKQYLKDNDKLQFDVESRKKMADLAKISKREDDYWEARHADAQYFQDDNKRRRYLWYMARNANLDSN